MLEVEFRNGNHDFYEKCMLRILLSDSEILHIVDLDTGELLK